MISAALLLGTVVAQTPSPVPRRLIDVVIFDGERLAQAVNQEGGFFVDKDSGGLPLDSLETWQGRPSLRLIVSGLGKQWSATLAGPGWASYDLSSYWQSGNLELTVKGQKGGETFKVAIADRDPIRRSSTVFSQNITVPSREWTTLQIPLRRLIADPSPFRLKQTAEIRLTGEKELAIYVGAVKITSPDKEPAPPAIKVNQVGYEPNWTKKAIVSGFAGEISFKTGTPFRVLDIADKVVFRGALTSLKDFDSASGDRLFTADFTPVKQTGTFRLLVDGAGESTTFEIRPSLYSGLLRDLCRYYYFQRSGVDLSPTHAGIFSRKAGHTADSALTYQSGTEGMRDASKGWYDAGDYGKYVPTASVAIGDLLWTYESFPSLFSDKHLTIPESNNNVPDLLDEIRWGLDWILKMQDETGGFYHKVWPSITDQIPALDKTQRQIYDKGPDGKRILPTASTANAAAVLAHASIVFAKTAPAFAAQCRSASLKAWDWLEKHPQEIVAEGMTYSEQGDKDNRLWAAFALYRLTGDEKLHNYIEANYKDLAGTWNDKTGNAGGERTMLAWPHYFLSAKQGPALIAWHKNAFQTWRKTQLDRWKTLGWGNFLLDQNYYWSSNAATAQTVMVLALNNRSHKLGEADILQAAIRNHDYLLGANPVRVSFVSGAGEESVKNVYSQIYNNDRLEQCPPGYMSGGPNQFQGKFYSRWPAKCYRDVSADWVSQEHCITYNAPMVFSTAFLLDSARRRQ